MKKIEIIRFLPPDKTSIRIKEKKYRVFLGNSKEIILSSKEKTASFLAKTNKFLNDRLIELRGMFAETWIQVNRMWFYFEKSPKFKDFERIIYKNLNDCENCFNLAVLKGHSSPDGNYLVWKFFHNIVNYCLYILDKLREIKKHKKLHLEVRELDILKDRFIDFDKKMKSYPD